MAGVAYGGEVEEPRGVEVVGRLAPRVAMYLAGAFVLCMGVVLNTKTGLGTAAMSTIPYAIQLIEGISLGTATFVIYAAFVAIQLALVRRVDVRILMQLPVSLLFGVMIDVIDIGVFRFEARGLVDGLVMLVAAIALTSLGVTLVVSARLAPVATDGIVQTLSDVTGWPFGRTKYAFDGACLCVTLAYTMVRVGRPVGIGFGTVLAVLLTGGACMLWGRLLGGFIDKLLGRETSKCSSGPAPTR